MATTDKKTGWIWSTIIGWAAVLFLLWFCNDQIQKKEAAQNNSKVLTQKNLAFKNKLGTITTEATNLKLEKNDLSKVYGDSVFQLTKQLSKVKTITRIETQFRIDTIRENFAVKIPCNFSLKDSTKEAHYSFNFKIDTTSITFTNLKIPNTQTVIIGYKRKSFLHPYYSVTQVTNSNPYMITTNVKSAEEAVPGTSFLGKLISFGLGAITTKYLAK